MKLSGGCHCGALRYEIEGEAVASAICHCRDCRKSTGAPLTGWLMIPREALTITGEPKIYASSEHGRRFFCGTCGASLFYANAETLPGLIDVQSGALDDPEQAPPRIHVMASQRIGWTRGLDALPEFATYPPSPE